jgi:Na+/H+ antiporter NhaD/arsenite permease-like protein
MNSVWLAGGIFLITYALIITERVHRTVSALLGGVAMILLGVLPQDQAFHAVAWNAYSYWRARWPWPTYCARLVCSN